MITTLSRFSSVCIGVSVLCLAGCSTTPQQTNVLPAATTTLPNGSVVLLDPTTDDGMLPALGEAMSKGAVTIFNLDGPGAPLPVVSAPAQPQGGGYMAGGGLEQANAPVQLRPPSTSPIAQGDEPRVTIFNLDSGLPTSEIQASIPFVPTTPPTLLPPVQSTKPLESPFKNGQPAASASDTGPVVLGNVPGMKTSLPTPTKGAEPKLPSQPRLPDGSTADVYSGTTTVLGQMPAASSSPVTPILGTTTTLGAGSRAVQATEMMAPPRPPKGMTY